MELRNAEKGIRKIFIAEIMAIIAAVMSGAASLFLGIQLNIDINSWTDVGWGIWGLVCGFVAISFWLIQLILGFVGYFQASKDETCFKRAMICNVAGGILMIFSSSIQSVNTTVYTVLSASGTIVEMFIMVYAIIGLLHLSERCERPDVTETGTLLLRVLVATYIVSALNALIIRIFELSDHAKIIALVTGVVELLLSMVQYLLFMFYLHKTKKMLADNRAAEQKEQTL